RLPWPVPLAARCSSAGIAATVGRRDPYVRVGHGPRPPSQGARAPAGQATASGSGFAVLWLLLTSHPAAEKRSCTSREQVARQSRETAGQSPCSWSFAFPGRGATGIASLPFPPAPTPRGGGRKHGTGQRSSRGIGSRAACSLRTERQ